MRIVFFISDLDGGGAQRTTVNLVNELCERGLDVTLIVARSDGPARNWIAKHVRFVDLAVGRTRRAVFSLRSELLRWKPDLLFATMVDSNIVATLASLGQNHRMKVILRETNSHRARGDIGRGRRALIGWAYRRADAVVALSSGVREELLADYRLESSKVVTIGNPVDIDAIVAASEAAKCLSAPFTNEGQPVVMAVGRLVRQKGFDHLIKAFARMKRPAKLVILGEGPDRDELLSLAESEGVGKSLTLPGFASNPTAWLAHADVFVLSSRWEGFGHVIVEAMAAGVPVVATDCPYGPADIVTHGEDGSLVRVGDPDAIAAAIEDLLDNREKAEQYRHAATAGISRFKMSKIVNEYISVFERLKT